MEAIQKTEPATASPVSPPELLPLLEQQDAVDIKAVNVAETGLPKKKQVLTKA